MLEHDLHARRTRQLILGTGLAFAIGYLIFALYQVQVASGETYRDKLRSQTTVAIRLSPARGAIVDRNGAAIAENRASFDIDLYLEELKRHYSREHRGGLPKITITKKRKGKVITEKETDIVKIVYDSIEPLNKSLGMTIKPDVEDLRTHFRNQPRIPFQFKTDVDFNTVAQFSERNLGIPGIEIAARPVRLYTHGAFASHIVGYTGKPESSEQVGDDGSEFETVGKKGIEKVYDSHLQGKPGGRILQVNYRGYIMGEEAEQLPTVGNSVFLTIDARIQYIVEEALRGVGRGSAVVMDPNNGDILAMASVPNFDPNMFVPKISAKDWKELDENPTAPMINRALSAYAPGSIYKIMVALAALKSKAITPKTEIHCESGMWIGNREFKDWYKGSRGSITVKEALQWSCNTFFYPAGIRTGIDKLVEMGHLFGFGEATEIPIPESTGLLPSPAWLKENRKNERWSEAYTANFSIGQGFVTVSPLQMCVMMSALANGGTVYYPRLISKIADITGDEKALFPTRIRSQLEMSMPDIMAVREGVLAVVESGTGMKSKVPGVKVAGKTGTAQFKTRLNGNIVSDQRTWFLSFAPFEKPRYAICVLVEGGTSGGGTCAPIAQNIYSRIFSMENGELINMAFLSPVEGHFHGVTDYVPPAAAGAAVPGAPPAATAVPPTEAGAAPEVVNEDDDGRHSRIMPKRGRF